MLHDPQIFRDQRPSARACMLAVYIGIGCAFTTALAQPEDAGAEDSAVAEATGTMAEDNASQSAYGRAPTPSRLVSDSELEAYLEQVFALLPMTSRLTDPFGSIQDPDAAPPPPPAIEFDIPDAPETPAIPFSEVVNRINITTIMPGENRFLVGTRSFQVNDVIPVNYRGQTYQVRVESVSSSRIRFRNEENDESANHDLDLLPAGMSAGGSQSSVPGMIRTGPDVPIDLN